VTHPFYAERTKGDKKRIAIVKNTYENAKEAGDKNVYFVDSSDFFTEEMRDLYAVDNLHPNDLGQFSMAEAIFPAVKKALANAEK
jgi:lysophospholipase L1-like esterase